jgi:hypothetical protein
MTCNSTLVFCSLATKAGKPGKQSIRDVVVSGRGQVELEEEEEEEETTVEELSAALTAGLNECRGGDDEAAGLRARIDEGEGMSFMELLTGSWDGYDMSSAALNVQTLQAPSAVSAVLGFGEGGNEQWDVAGLIQSHLKSK